MSVELVGQYYGDSYGGGGVHTAAVGWQGLKIGDIKMKMKKKQKM